jgi:exopolysaccharide production protein ExoY
LSSIDNPILAQTAVSPRFSLPEAAERAGAFAMLALATPVIATSAAVVRLISRRSPFVAHLRVGRHGKPFWTFKLRSMWSSDHPGAAARGWIEYVVAEPDEGGKHRSDPRIASRFAAFCRRHSIDELPQLWHVVRGEMSLVGPRPLTRSEVERHYGVRAAELLSVKPGITGLWQVYGRSAIRFPQRSAMDLEMIRSLNARMYLRILLRTIPAIIRGNGAW